MTLALTFDEQATLRAWAAPRCGVETDWPRGATALGAIDRETGRIRAVMVVVQRYAVEADLHFASDGSKSWATPDIFAGFFAYPFMGLKVRRVQCVVATHNLPCIIMCLKLGFSIEARLWRTMDDGSDGYLMTMRAEDCAWIKTGEAA